jgi:hypothetical protein
VQHPAGVEPGSTWIHATDAAPPEQRSNPQPVTLWTTTTPVDNPRCGRLRPRFRPRRTHSRCRAHAPACAPRRESARNSS